jgi:hypothetical protein
LSGDEVAETWLEQEDRVCRDDRLDRLKWVASLAPKENYWLFCGGQTAKFLLEEARYCFVYGQFLAASLVGTAFVELTLAAKLYASGRSDLKRANFSKLLEEAVKTGWINDAQHAQFTHVRVLRNRIAHFREPGEDETVERVAFAQQILPYELLEENARMVMTVAMRLLQRDIL